MALTRTLSSTPSTAQLNATRTVTGFSPSGSLGNKVNSVSVTLGFSTYNGTPTYNIAFTVSDGSSTISSTLALKFVNGVDDYTQTYRTVTLPTSATSMNWNSSNISISVTCDSTTPTGADKGKLYLKGNQKITISSETVNPGGSSGSGESGSGSTISASSVKLDKDTVTVGQSITCTITPTDNTNRHRISWKIGTTQIAGTPSGQYIPAGTTTQSLTITAEHMDRIPNSTTAILTCTVDTYTSTGTTSLGSAPVNATVTVPDSYKPDFTIAMSPEVLKLNKYVVGVTYPNVNITSISTGRGATITSYSVACSGISTQIVNTTFTGNTTFKFNDTNAGRNFPVAKADANTVTVTFTDSRGRSTSKTTTFTAYAYANPSVISYDTYRCDSSGNADNEGTYVYVTASFSLGSGLGGSNSISATSFSSKLSSDSNYEIKSSTKIDSGGYVILSGFDNKKTYDIRIGITDTYGTTIYVYDKIFPYNPIIVDISGNKNNVCVGIGTIVENGNNAVVINGNWDLYYGDASSPFKQYFVRTGDVNNVGDLGDVHKILYATSLPTGGNYKTGQICIIPAPN